MEITKEQLDAIIDAVKEQSKFVVYAEDARTEHKPLASRTFLKEARKESEKLRVKLVEVGYWS